MCPLVSVLVLTLLLEAWNLEQQNRIQWTMKPNSEETCRAVKKQMRNKKSFVVLPSTPVPWCLMLELMTGLMWLMLLIPSLFCKYFCLFSTTIHVYQCSQSRVRDFKEWKGFMLFQVALIHSEHLAAKKGKWPTGSYNLYQIESNRVNLSWRCLITLITF